ncbi:MAG: hypothetical protein GY731_13220 [Gammaproteobacteria bacterium]|nr:hypothetical protein [Gammaproteobacteria bacterium]
MGKIIKSDIVVGIVFIGVWLFYLTYDGTTRFDINQTATLPLLVAADFTALAILYVAGRYYTAGKDNLIGDKLNNMMQDHHPKNGQNRT